MTNDVPAAVTPRNAFCSAESPEVRILLVEDLPICHNLACMILRGAGHLVEIANDGIEAVAAVKASSYDLVLMDIEMPRMNGFNAAHRIRELPGAAGQTPIVALTAVAIPKHLRAFREAGMDGYVAKPFQQQELLFAALNSRRLRLDGPGQGCHRPTRNRLIRIGDRIRLLRNVILASGPWASLYKGKSSVDPEDWK